MVPIDLGSNEVDRNPAGVVEIGGPGISFRVGFDQHCLLVEAPGAHADHGPLVSVMIGAILGELLARDEERRLPVREALRRFGKLERSSADAIQWAAHLCTNSLRILG